MFEFTYHQLIWAGAPMSSRQYCVPIETIKIQNNLAPNADSLTSPPNWSWLILINTHKVTALA